jgi:phosphate transport system substrate-binding protein
MLTLAVAAMATVAAVDVDPALPDYQPAQGVTGSIKSVGSDTMNNMMALWGEGFKAVYPSVQIEIEGKGSGTAPPALVAGTSTFGPMSRAMKSKEADVFEKAFGYKPTQLQTSIDMLAVFVHKDNPIEGLSLTQLDGIFSSTFLRGGSDVTTWGQAGMKGEWESKPIQIYGRDSSSGTHGFFKKSVCKKGGDFKPSINEQPGSSAVVSSVGKELNAIGYSGIGYKTPDTRVVPLAAEDGAEFVPATDANAYSGKYPLSRFLYLSVNYKPGSKLEPLRAEFVKFIFSKQGQEAVVKDGYYPVPAAIARKALESVGVKPTF